MLTIANGEFCSSRTGASASRCPSALSNSRTLSSPRVSQTSAKKRLMNALTFASTPLRASEERVFAPSISSMLKPTSLMPFWT